VNSKLWFYRGICERVIDGDTIVFTVDLGFDIYLKSQKMRFAGINTPESRTRNKEEKVLGLAAKDRVIELLPAGSKFIFHSLGFGKFGRTLGIPFFENKSICQILIDEGHARPYSGGKREPWLSQS
jgi:micrococcal nuclease